MSPTLGRHQVLVVEDADRVTERRRRRAAQGDRGAGAADGAGSCARRRPTTWSPPSAPGAGCSPCRRRPSTRWPSCCRPATGSIRSWPSTPPGPHRVTSAELGARPGASRPRPAHGAILQIPFQLKDLVGLPERRGHPGQDRRRGGGLGHGRPRQPGAQGSGGGARLRHQGRPAAAGRRRDEGPRRPAEGAGQATAAGRDRPRADRADRLLSGPARRPDQCRRSADQRRARRPRSRCWPAGRRPKRPSARSTLCSAAAKRWRATSRRCWQWSRP